VDGEVVSDYRAQVHGDRVRVEGQDQDFAAAFGHLHALLRGANGPRAFDRQIDASAARQLLNARHGILLAGIDEMIGAEATAHLQTIRARPHQNDLGGSELFAGLDRHQSHGSGAKDGDVVARYIASRGMQAVQARPSGGEQHSILKRQLGWQLVQRADVVQDVLREPAIGGDATGAMSLGRVAIIQARCIPADETVIAPTATVMGFDTNLVADGELIDGLSQGDHRTGPLVPGSKGAIRQGGSELPMVGFEVAATGATHGDLDQDLAGAGPRDKAVHHAYVPWAKEHGRTHRRRNELLFGMASHCRGHDIHKLLRDINAYALMYAD
jgi:hypothetical protein